MVQALTAAQAKQLAQLGDKFIFTNDADTGTSLGAARIPAAQAQNLEALLGYVPQNLTYSGGRVMAPDANGNLADITQYVDMNTYVPHDQTVQTKADSLLAVGAQFGLRALAAYGFASGLGSLTNTLMPQGTEFADMWSGMPQGTTEWNGMIPPGSESTLPAASNTIIPQPPTGDASDWYKTPSGDPIPSNTSILPNGDLVPQGTPGSVPLAPSPTNPIPPGHVTIPTGVPGVPPTGTIPPVVTNPGVTTPSVTTPTTGGDIDWGKVIAGIVGAYGSSEMAKQYRETADKYMAMGAPSRDRYEASFAPGFTMMNDPGYKDAMDSVGKESAAAMSMHGNPADAPNAWKQTQLDVYNKVAYPALQGYRQTNASAGGLASFASAVPAADTAATGAQQNIWNAGGSIASNLFSAPNSQDALNAAMTAYFRKQAGLG